MTPPASKRKQPGEATLVAAEILTGTPLPRKGFYLVSAGDPYIFGRLEKVFIEEFLKDDPSRMNRTYIECDGNTRMNDILSLCDEYPFGSSHRLVILGNTQRLSQSAGEQLKNYLADPSPTAIIVLNEFTDDDRGGGGRFSPARSLKSLLKSQGLHIQGKMKPAQMREWIGSRFRSEGKKIDRSSIELLIETVGQDMWDLHQEIIKICLFAGRRENIRPDDVREVASHHIQSKIFNLTEMVGMKNTGGALQVAEELMREKDTGFMMLVVLNNHFNLLYQLNCLIQENLTSEQAAKKLHRHPFYVKKCMAQARRFNNKAFMTIFDLLSRADGAIKQGMDLQNVVEMTIIQICRMPR